MVRKMPKYNENINDANIKTDDELFVMKRSGMRIKFDIERIVNAISKANDEMTVAFDKLSDKEIREIALKIEKDARKILINRNFFQKIFKKRCREL